MLTSLLQRITSQIEQTEDVEQLKALTKEKESIEEAIAESATLTETIDALKAENATLKNDLINALKNSVVKSNKSPVNEIKTDAEIYAEWKEKVLRNE